MLVRVVRHEPVPEGSELRRILVLGTTGSGKTTFGRELARSMGVRFVELDALYWEANWTPASAEVFRARVAAATASDAWIVDGNYHAVRDILWPRAEAAVWLDYPLVVILGRLVRRTIRRTVRHDVLWGTNVEPTGLRVFSRDSLFVWLFRTYWRRKCQMPELFKRPEFAHLRIVRFRWPKQADAWLARCRSVRGNDSSQGTSRIVPRP